jgi:hypothetical protein
MINKNKLLPTFKIIVVVLPLLSVFLFSYKAQAGGYDSLTPPAPTVPNNDTPSTPTKPSEAISQPSQSNSNSAPEPTKSITSPVPIAIKLPPLFVWEKWGNPYWSDDKVCRENNGNIVCLTGENAKKIGWNIPNQ